jgi:protein required for attachment to host cells
VTETGNALDLEPAAVAAAPAGPRCPRMANKKTWILVCDASRAHLFEEAKPGGRWSPVAAFEHPESRARVTDLVADVQGRKPVGGPRAGIHTPPGGFHGRPGAEPDTDPREAEAMKFARELAAVLDKGLDDHAYDALVLAAPPHFLGLLKETLGDQVGKHVVETLDKDLATLEPREIEARLRAARAA